MNTQYIKLKLQFENQSIEEARHKHDSGYHRLVSAYDLWDRDRGDVYSRQDSTLSDGEVERVKQLIKSQT